LYGRRIAILRARFLQNFALFSVVRALLDAFESVFIWRLSSVRPNSLVVFGFASLVLTASTSPLEAQRHHGGSYHPYYAGYSQWYPYPYPVFGFPPGVYPDHVVALRLQVTPREALVYVDGFAAGVVDDYDGVFQRLRLIPGPHEIVIYHPGYRTLRQNVYYNPGSTHTIKHALDALAPGEAPEPQPIPRPLPPGAAAPPQTGAPVPDPGRMGTLALRVQPADATILVDGEPWRSSQPQDRLVIQLAEGTHRVRVEKPGYQTFAVDVDVRAGETASFNVSLTGQ
jgi:hypothetical protein